MIFEKRGLGNWLIPGSDSIKKVVAETVNGVNNMKDVDILPYARESMVRTEAFFEPYWKVGRGATSSKVARNNQEASNLF